VGYSRRRRRRQSFGSIPALDRRRPRRHEIQRRSWSGSV